MKTIEEKAQEALDSLNESVEEALEIKSRLGQYAVIWDEEKQKVVRILPKGKPMPNKYQRGEK